MKIEDSIIDSNIIKILTLEEIDRILSFLKDKSGPPRGINYSYLWEIASSKMMRIFYTESKDIDNLFYGYYIKNGVVIEDWYSNGFHYEQSVLDLIKFHPSGEILFAFEKKSAGNKFGWKFIDEIKEMTCSIGNRDFDDTCPNFNKYYKEKVSSLLSQQWWNKTQAKNFVNITSSNPKGFSKIILNDNENVIGFCHTMYSEDSGWISCVYIDKDHRGKGHAYKLVESTIARLKEIGITKVFLGVDKSNKEANKLYGKLGFKFTDFTKWQFKVDRACLLNNYFLESK